MGKFGLFLALAAVLGVASRSEAGMVYDVETVTGFADGTSSSSPNSFTIQFDNLPTLSGSDGVLGLWTFGDFDSNSEWIDVSIEGTYFGRIWDGNAGNDSFNSFWNMDVGSAYGIPFFPFGESSTYLILNVDLLNTFLADGILELTLSLSPSVSNNFFPLPQESITASLKYTSIDVPPPPTPGGPGTIAAPEPSSLAILGIGSLCGLGAVLRRRKMAKSDA